MNTSTIQSLAIEQLSFIRQGQTILNHVDLPPLHTGQVLAVVGPNGAGKSSLVRCICGLNNYTGTLRFNGDAVASKAVERRQWNQHIGYVPQNVRIDSRLTVSDLLLLAQKTDSYQLHVSKAELHRVAQVLQRLGISHLAQRDCTTLSGGQMQMVAMAQGMILSPSLLLLDEPTSALDLSRQLVLLDTMRRYVEHENAMAVVVLHDLNLALKYADRLLLLNEGAVAEEGALPDALSLASLRQYFAVEAEYLQSSRGEQQLVVLGPV